MADREVLKDEVLEEMNGGAGSVSPPRCDTINTSYMENQNKNFFGSFFHGFMNLFKKDTPADPCDIKGDGILYDDKNMRG